MRDYREIRIESPRREALINGNIFLLNVNSVVYTFYKKIALLNYYFFTLQHS